jgi:hypothetical protein
MEPQTVGCELWFTLNISVIFRTHKGKWKIVFGTRFPSIMNIHLHSNLQLKIHPNFLFFNAFKIHLHT